MEILNKTLPITPEALYSKIRSCLVDSSYYSTRIISEKVFIVTLFDEIVGLVKAIPVDSIYSRVIIEKYDVVGKGSRDMERTRDNILEVIAHNPSEPWRHSRPNYQDRDKVIWEKRNANYTWEEVAELADCAVSTAKDVYKRLKTLENT